MKLAILTLLCMGTVNVLGECGGNAFAASCWDTPNIAKIGFTDGGVCECLNYVPEEDACVVVAAVTEGLTAADLTGNKCEEICEASNSGAPDNNVKCEFFRWEKDGSANSHCTLMNTDQCDGGFNSCARGQCLSGQANCDGGMTPVPEDVKCAAGVVFLNQPDAVHWYCVNPEDYEMHINIYGEDAVPTGVICRTAHKCKAFDNEEDDEPTEQYANEIVVQCNPERAAEATEEATWGQFKDSNNKVTDFIVGTTLIDPVCETKATDLILDAPKLQEPGVSFICENPFTTAADKFTVPAPNTCALLCNFHTTLTIESELADDGTGVWNKYDAGSDDGSVVVPENVKCWDFMKI